jgi:hypothetical protein
MKKIHCPHCLSMDLTFIKSLCTDKGELCGDHMQCDHCGTKFVVAYDLAFIAGMNISLPVVDAGESGKKA